jgi:ubiquinone/menaquinone biosynthesis C-methylase UbiE
MAAHDDTAAVRATYAAANLSEAILAGLRAAGKDPDALQMDDLAPVDQFHTGGKPATLALAQRAGLTADMHVLDVGGGIGGPARTLASALGCTVTVLDLTEDYCRAGAMLTARVGLQDRVTFRCDDALAMPFPAASFDAVWTQHSSMNIADKQRLYAEMHRVLRPGGRLALHEVMAGPNQPIHFPVPWAREPSASFLQPANTVRAIIRAAGFDETAWSDESEAARDWFRSRLSAAATQSGPPPLGIHLLIGADSGARIRNFLRNLEEVRVTVIQAVFARATA